MYEHHPTSHPQLHALGAAIWEEYIWLRTNRRAGVGRQSRLLCSICVCVVQRRCVLASGAIVLVACGRRRSGKRETNPAEAITIKASKWYHRVTRENSTTKRCNGKTTTAQPQHRHSDATIECLPRRLALQSYQDTTRRPSRLPRHLRTRSTVIPAPVCSKMGKPGG